MESSSGLKTGTTARQADAERSRAPDPPERKEPARRLWPASSTPWRGARRPPYLPHLSKPSAMAQTQIVAELDPEGGGRPDPQVLYDLARMRMPFGRYAGRRLADLPAPYLGWFESRGYPKGRLGELLQTLLEIKANGLDALLDPLRDPSDPRYRAPRRRG